MGRYTAGGVGRDVVVGAAAGIAAIWVANKLDQAMYRGGSPKSLRKTEAARPGGMDPSHVLAKRAADAVGIEVGNPKDNPAGHTIQYGIAAGIGALYGLLRGMSPAVTMWRGAVFGIASFVLKDEIGNTAMGTAGNPLHYPIRDHVRGAATHAVFGIVTDLGLRLAAPWRDQVVIVQGPPLSERVDRGRAYLQERGRENLAMGRGYLEQGIGQARQLANQARANLPRADVTEAARRGRTYAGQVAGAVRSRMPDYDEVTGIARAGRRQTARLAESARAYVPDVPTSAISRAVQRVFG